MRKLGTAVILLLAVGMAGQLGAQQPDKGTAEIETALAEGRILAAGRLAKAALVRTGNKDANLLYLAAQVAVMAGEDSLALSRFRAFVAQSTEKGPRMRNALDYVLTRGVYVEGLSRYIDLLGADENVWTRGLDFIKQSIADDVPDQAAAAVELLITHYAADATKMDALAKSVADLGTYVRKNDALCRRVGQAAPVMRVSDQYQLRRLLDTCWPALNAEERFEGIVRVQKTLDRPLTEHVFKWFAEINKLPEAQRDAAGKTVLAFEPMYRDHGDAQDYRRYLWRILDSPLVFHAPGHELVNDAQVQQRMDLLTAKLKNRLDARDLLKDPFRRVTAHYLGDDKAAQAAFLQKHMGLLQPSRFRDLAHLTEGKQLDAQVTQWSQGKPAWATAELKGHVLDWYNHAKNKTGLIAAAREVMLASTGTWDFNHIMRHFIGSGLPTPDEKVGVLNAVRATEGSSAALRSLIAAMEKRDKTWADHAAFKTLKAVVALDKPAADPARRAILALKSIKLNAGKPDPRVYATAETFLKEYKGRIPGDSRRAATTEERLANAVLSAHIAHVWNNAAETGKAATLWGPHIDTTGAEFYLLLRRTHEHRRYADMWPAAKAYAALVKKGQPLDDGAAGRLDDCCPKGEAVSLFSGMLEKLGDQAPAWLSVHMHTDPRHSRWPFAFYIGELETALALPNTRFSQLDLARCIDIVHRYPASDAVVSEPLAMTLTDQLLTATPHTLDYTALARLYAIFSHEDRHEAARRWFDALMRKLQPRPAVARLNAALAIAGRGGIRDPDNRAHILLTVAKPMIDGIPGAGRRGIGVNYRVLQQCRLLASEGDDAARKKAGQALYLQVAGLALTDGHVLESTYQNAVYCKDSLTDMIARGDWRRVLQALSPYTAAAVFQTDWNACRRDLVNPIVTALEEKEAFEALFVFAGMMQARVTGGREQAGKELMAVKGRAARNIPGLLPVDKRDPTYDLHLAAQLLGLGNETRAWSLTQPKLALLRDRWLGLSPAYVAWAIDRMRKQSLYKPALDFAFAVLMKEMDFEPELMARVSLVKGDIYRDQENFQAARIEYQSLLVSARYKKTRSGLEARYRLINLLIQTRNYANADARLQRLVDAGSLREQAEAYYLYANMAFEQKEYALAQDHLRDVFRRLHGHVYGRLLEGELRLLLPRGLASTEVPIGRLDLQTIAVPGRELTLKLQDSNLAIARGGKAIPVIVTTTRGRDEEHVKLLVSADDETLFSGTIATRLGEPKKNNLVLEVRGNEQVSYQIEPHFQKANDLNYAPKHLLVKADAELVVGSGEILSREAREKVELEQRMARYGQWDQSAWKRQHRDTRVRPGSPIYVQVTDFDRDLSAQPDRVTVDLETSSGDVLAGSPLTETGPHTGIFSARIPTAVPYPMATASDTEEGKDPNTIINTGRPKPWSGVADGKQGKWVEVDTMTSHNVKTVTLVMPGAERIRRLRLLGSLADGLGLLAEFPPSAEAVQGGLLVQMRSGSHARAEQIRGEMRRHVEHSFVAPQPVFYRPDTKIGKRNGWYITRMAGTFWLPENRLLDLKFIQETVKHGWQYAYVFIDGEYVMGGAVSKDSLQRSVKRFVPRGAHTLEVLLRDHWAESRLEIGVRQEDDTFARMPAEWFSTEANPPLAALLKPRARIRRTETGFTAETDEPRRVRRLRWVFEDFDGQSLSVSAIHVVDDSGKTVIPSAHDFSMGRQNRILEVAAGDQIEISYSDEQRLDPDNPVLTAHLGASFANATVQLAYEEMVTDHAGNMTPVYEEARRARAGDQLMVIVTDFDEDLTDKRDTVAVTVSTTSGEKLLMKALETKTSISHHARDEHAGRFLQVLKFGAATQGNTIKLGEGDTVRVRYVDRENTAPGVPVEREYTVTSAGNVPPDLNVFRTRVVQIEDHSPIAKLKAERLRRQGMAKEDIRIYVNQVIGELDVASKGNTSAVPVSARAPILIEAFHPSMALHRGSRCEVTALAESERAAAALEGREPTVATIPLVLEDITQVARWKGYPVRLSGRTLERPETLLAGGRFAGVLRLQLGSPGDEADDRVRSDEASFGVTPASARSADQEERFRVPTLVVAGNDVVHLSIRDETNHVLTTRSVRLLSNAQVDIMDRSFTVPVEAIHLGQKFYVRVTDPDRDTSDERQVLRVAVRAIGGDAVTLSLEETLPHSGVFSGTIEPVFAPKDKQGKVAPPNTDDDTLHVQFGETVTFLYIDPTSLGATGSTNVVTTGKVYRGADGRLASFTKQFKDPEMAVKTRFLMAEALFEMAKDHRKLKRLEEADAEIARGKRILEEAMRDYPNTSLVAQGEFLLANLAQEQDDFQEAIGRYSRVISRWPDSEYASRSQFKKAICLEKMDHYEQACEEYVKLTYLYPNSPLVADATVRLGNYYYKHRKYRTAGRIFERFQERHPAHALAAKALFLAGQSYMKMENERAENIVRDYTDAVLAFRSLVEKYPDDKSIRPEAMYWLGDCLYRDRDYVKAYQSFKNLTWDYPTSKWAKISRGRLTEEVFVRVEQE